MNDDFFDIDGAAGFLKLSKWTIYRKTMKNKIPCHRPFGGKIIFSKRELEEFIIHGRKINRINISNKQEV